MIVTEWEQLEGKTILEAKELVWGELLLVFEDGDYILIGGSGEEHHGAHWPIICEDNLGYLEVGVLEAKKRRLEVENVEISSDA